MGTDALIELAINWCQSVTKNDQGPEMDSACRMVAYPSPTWLAPPSFLR
jgi:hypothetical protein